MKKRIGRLGKFTLGLAVLILAVWCYRIVFPPRYEASATPQEGLVITYSVKPMFSMQSDWTRKVAVKYGSLEIQQSLFEDTGWWMGSNLYRYKSGVYVVHEGQGGCFAISVDPLSFDVQENISCEKSAVNLQENGGASLFYPGFTYLGAFVETRDRRGVPISFIPADVKPEAELSDPL